VARLLHGLSGAAIITSGFAAGSTLWPNNFGEQVGKLVGVATIGGLLGPAIGGFAFELGQDLAFIVLAALTGLAIPIVALAWRDIDGGKGASREGAQAIERVPLRMFFDNPMLFRIGILVFLSTLATGALEAGVPLFLSDEPLSMSVGWIGATILLLVVLQGGGSWWWGRLVDKRGPVRYMLIGWSGVSIALMAAAVIILLNPENLGMMIIVVGFMAMFQFSVAAAQVPVLPMIDTATCQAYGRGGAGLAFGAAGTVWAAGAIVGPMMIGPVLDLTGSWALTFGLLVIPCSIGLVITMRNREILEECYFSEMKNRSSEE
jgi:MFS family permease